MDANPGPIDGSVLYDQDKHVSAAVWDGQERGALRCHEHTSKLGEWRLTPKQIELVEKAGFGYLRKIPAISLDNPLISALVERWRRETNTFHFSVGEMTVTLQDVALLLGLAIDGKPVIGITHTACGAVCEKLLGKAPDSSYASGGMVKLSWLKEFFSLCPENAPTQQVEHCTRAYLLYLVGSTIFSTTTGNKVPVMYLPLFENFEESGRFAWGAAALAFLYRALGNACVKSQSTICGCLTLLQCWSYFHLNIGRPKLNRDPIHDHFPFVLRWKGKQSGPTTNRDVVFYRKALDSLKPSDVEWLPYKYMDSTVIPEDIKDTLILGRSKTMLICFDKAERHLPDRCLRQYGMLQPIPEEVVRWVRKSRGVDGGVDLSGKMESELSEWSDRRLYIVDGEDGVDEIEYMQWYLRITRKVVGRPISLSSEFQRTISGLREIAYLADSFSTKGLDGQQFESITRIRFIAQDCLRDQAGSPVTPSATTQIELGKRSRGKERIRRKDSIKRRRKDDETEYYEGSEDDQSQFYGAVIEVDQLPLRQDDVCELQLPQADDEVDPQQLYLTPDEEDIAELHVMVNKADDANLSNTSGDINNNQPCDKTNESVKDSQVCDATMEDVGDPVTHDLTYEVNASQLHQSDTCEVPGSKPIDTTKKVNDQELHNTTISGATNTNLSDPIKENKDLHLPDASEDTKELQLPDGTKEGDGSQVVDAPVDSQDLQHPNATEEKNGLQLPDATKEDKSLQPQGANKEGLQIPAAAKEEKGLEIPHAAKDVNGSWIRNSDEGSGSQVSDATKEGSSSQVPDAAKNGEGSQVPDRTEGPKDLHLQEAVEKEKDLQIQEAAKKGKDLHSQEAAEKGKKAARKGKELQIKEAAGKEKEVQLQETAKKGKDLQIQEAAGKGKGAVGKGKDVQFHEAAKKGKEMRLQEAAGKEKRLQPQEASKKGNKLQPQEAAKKEELQPHRAEERGKDLQLQEAAEKGKELQLQEKTEKEELQIQDTTIEAAKGKELHFQDTTNEGKDLQFSDATEDKELELKNASKEAKDFQLSDATDKGNLRSSNATGGTNDMQQPDATNEENDSKPSHSADGSDPLAAKSAPKDVPKGVVQS